MFYIYMLKLPDPQKIDIFSPDATAGIDYVLKYLYHLRENLRVDLHRHDPPIERKKIADLCSTIDGRILLGQHALVAQTFMKAVGKFDLNKSGVLIYSRGPEGWTRGEGDLEKKVCEYKQVSFDEWDCTRKSSMEEDIENIGPQNIILVDNPSSLLWAKEKVGIGFSLLQSERAAYRKCARETRLVTLPIRLFRWLTGRGFRRFYTTYIPLSRIDERRDAIIYARSRSRAYWCSTNLNENSSLGMNKSNIPAARLFVKSPEEQFHLLQIVERYHPNHNVFLAYNRGYPRFARMQMTDVLGILHARYQVFKRYSESIAVQRIVNMQPGEPRSRTTR